MEDRISVDVYVRTETHITRHRKEKMYDGDDLEYENTIEGWYKSHGGPYSIDPNDFVYAVYCVYDTGDSFHTEKNLMEVMMVNQNEEMAQRNVAVLEAERDGNNYHVHLYKDDGTTFQITVPYYGYFEHFRSAGYELIDES